VRLTTRYVLREICGPLAVCVGALYAMLFALQLLRGSDVMLGSSVTLKDFARVALYMTPHFLVVCLPVAFLLALLLGLGRMNEDRELTALSTLGVAPWRTLAVPVGIGAAVGMAMALLAFTGEPWGLSSLEAQMNEIIKKNVLGDVKAGTFYEEIPGFTLYVSDADMARGEWNGVLVHDERDPVNPLLVLAREGRVDAAGYSSALKLELTDGQVHLANPAGADYTRLDFEKGDIVVGVVQTLFQKNWRASSAEQMTPGELFDAAREARAKGEDPRPLLLAGHGRLANALAPVAFALVGGPLAMSPRQKGRGRAFLLTLAAYVAYYLLSKTAQNFGAEGRLAVPLAAQLANIVFAALGLWSLARYEVAFPKRGGASNG
jgi:lipopolysaccharide export system permease protein